MNRDDDGTGSQRSGVTGSETSSQRDSKFLLRRRGGATDASDEEDLLEQKRTIEDGVFSCMYTLVRTSALSSWKFVVIKIALEFLMFFVVSFNPEYTHWTIDVSSPVWQLVRWSLWRSPIIRLYGYKTYIIVMYVMAVMVYLAVAGLVFLTHSMRRAEQSKSLRMAALYLHGAYDIIFFTCYASFFDYFVFAANCDFAGKVKKHMYFDSIMCFKMPHLLHFSVAVLTAIVFLAVTVCLVVASGDLNPVTRGTLSSPTVYPRLKVLAAKALFILCADVLDSVEKVQAVLNVSCVVLICWWILKSLPFYRTLINSVWFGLWLGILYTTSLYCVVVFQNDHEYDTLSKYTKYVLYGMFPVIVGGAALCGVYAWVALRPAQRFRSAERDGCLGKLYKFSDTAEVERLSRCMRVLDADGVVDEAAAYWGETVLKAGMQAFPNDPYLLILYANFLLEVRKDGPAARTQLQLASKHMPSVVQRYQVFCTHEASKRLKDSQECGMDLQAYIEFKRNYRAVLRVHKEALGLQVEMWKLYLRPRLKVAEVDAAMDALDQVTSRAHQVYKRVLERYPTNGKLLRCYGKFLEDVRHDPAAAARAYTEANRNGGAGALLSLDLTRLQMGSGERPEVFASVTMEDAIVVINAEGTIMMVSQAVQSLFGYASLDLEGANVSLLMPPPFTQRHNGYMARYAATGEAHILDTAREVVGLHKDRYVFPVSICVTKLSGTGSDSVFLGLLRPIPPSLYAMRVWISPNGIFLCGEQSFASMVGLAEGELVGKSLSSLVAPMCQEALTALLERCHTASMSELAKGDIRTELQLLHRYMDLVPVEVTVGMAGTDGQRILVLNCRRLDGRDGNILVVDSHMRLKFVSVGIAGLLGYSPRKMITMRLDQLLPQPFNAMHVKWIRDPPHFVPPASCRSGLVVHLLNEYGTRVPVRIKLLAGNSTDTNLLSSVHHVAQVEKVVMGEELEERRLVLTVDFHGRVRGVVRPDCSVFGFPSWTLLDASLWDFVDVFEEWRQHSGQEEMQLLLLALLDKEQEMPGTSWRVRVREPARAEELEELSRTGSRHLTALARRSTTGRRTENYHGAAPPAWRSACLQVELFDEHAAADGGPVSGDVDDDGDGSQARVRVVLWRRDLLSGVVELDEDLTVRKASATTGLIFGLPAAFMRKKPLGKFLDVPHGSTWTSIVASQRHHHHHHHQRSALKSSSDRGIVSPPLVLTGAHPDGGSMQVVMQGVETLGPGGKPKVCAVLHADTSFVGARADIMRVLHLHVGHPTSSAAAASEPVATTAATTAAATATAALGRSASAVRGAADDAGCGGGGGAVMRRLSGAMSVRAPAVDGVVGLAPGPLRRISEEGDGRSEDGDGEAGGGGGGDNVSFSDGVSRGIRRHSTAVSSVDLLAAEDNDGDDDGDGDDGGSTGSAVNDPADQDAAAREVARLHRQATSRSEFTAQWVRTVMAHRVSTAGGFGIGPSAADGGGDGGGGRGLSLSLHRRPNSVGASAGVAVTPSPRLSFAAGIGSTMRHVGATFNASSRSMSIRDPSGGRESGSGGGLAAVADETSLEGGNVVPQHSRRRGARLSMRTQTEGGEDGDDVGGGHDGDGARPSGDGDVDDGGGDHGLERLGMGDGADGGGGGGDTWDRDRGAAGKWDKSSDAGESSVDDSEVASGFTSVTDQSSDTDLTINVRRQRLHKALDKVLLGPSLALPVTRLHLTSYAIMAIMLMAHVVCYIVVKNLINEEHNHIYRVHQAALATDKAQLIMWRIMMGPYCERKNITDKSSACGNTMSYTLAKLRENIAVYETYHHGVYLGVEVMKQLESRVYDLWTTRSLQYNIFLDSNPARVVEASSGIWQLGNRFLAAARESLYWMPKLKDKYMLHRNWKFIVYAGMGPLFNGCTLSLDYLMQSAWRSVEKLKIDLIVIMVVEALCIQLVCSAFQWYLVARVERARVVGLIAMLGLPAPVLRQLASQDVKVLDDDDEDDDSSNGSEDQENGFSEGPKQNPQLQHHNHHHHWKQQQKVDAQGGKDGGVGAQADGESSDISGDAAGAVVAAAAVAVVTTRRRPRGRPAARVAPASGSPGDGADETKALTLALPVPRLLGSADGSAPQEVNSPTFGQHSDAPKRRQVLLSSRTGKFMRGEVGAAEVLSPLQRDANVGPGRRVSDIAAGGGRRLSNSGNGSNGADGGFQLARAAAVLGGRGTCINGKVLVPSYANTLRLVVPFLLLNTFVIVVYVVSLSLLSGMQGPLASLNMAAHVVYRYTHMRCCAWGLVAADDSVTKGEWRNKLKEQINLFEDEYNVLMYGGIANSQLAGVFQEAVPASTFASVDFAREFFRSKRCFRWDQSLCLPPGHKYYEATHNGLDAMVRRVIQEMQLLSLDEDRDAKYNGTRYDYIHLVGGRDCYEGLQTAAQLFIDYSIRRYNEVTQLHTILLGTTCGIFALYTLLLLWPRLARIRGDAARQSALLSHVPAELDVKSHVKMAFRRWMVGGKRKSARSAASAHNAGTTGSMGGP
ncbi:hypothetical protein Vafri_20979 [Volvox africanus]|uniref:PAS domain-containing protein n=1 Tax=Volvox africanus TaxID=51714 RepID=A0A8J4BSM8_9CHLO|nr:hypothetical protein Vafri_20979 [Volvox africanus]